MGLHLEVENLSLKIEDRLLFDEVSFKLFAGDLLCISGNSGRGKTSLLRLICDEPVPAQSRFLGQIHKHVELSYCPQEMALSSQLDALTNVCTSHLPAKTWWQGLLGFDSSELHDAFGLLKELGLEKQSHQPVRRLSGGEQQRVAIARTLFSPSPLLLFDEPVSQLDWDRSNQVLDLIQKQVRTLGKSAILVLHDERLIEKYASRVLHASDIRWSLK